MTPDPDQPQVPADRPSLAPSVAGDLEAIFADAAPRAGPRTAASKVRAVSGGRCRWPMATVGAVAAAGLVGLSAGAGLVGLRTQSKASPTTVASATAPAPAAAPAVIPVQVAAVSPTVSLSKATGPVPVLDTEPVADTPSARAYGAELRC
jgi:hypothetical protein